MILLVALIGILVAFYAVILLAGLISAIPWFLAIAWYYGVALPLRAVGGRAPRRQAQVRRAPIRRVTSKARDFRHAA